MVLKRLFANGKAPAANTNNEAPGRAYALSPEHALAQMAVTGMMHNTFYASAEQQLDAILALAAKVSPGFVARTAVYCRERGFMKDVPALLVAYLAKHDVGLMKAVFPRVVDNGKMLRNFVQIVRSGTVGRRSLGSAPKRAAQAWFSSRTPETIFRNICSECSGDYINRKVAGSSPAGSNHGTVAQWVEQANEVSAPLVAACGGGSTAESRVASPRIRVRLPAAAPVECRRDSIGSQASWRVTRGSNPHRLGLFDPRRPFLRRGAVAARLAHNQEAVGSIPTSATASRSGHDGLVALVPLILGPRCVRSADDPRVPECSSAGQSARSGPERPQVRILPLRHRPQKETETMKPRKRRR